MVSAVWYAAGWDGKGPLEKNGELKNIQVVQIPTAPSCHLHLNWLCFVRTHLARSKIRHWLLENESDLIFDRTIVAKRKAGALAKPGAPSAPGGRGSACTGPTAPTSRASRSFGSGASRWSWKP